MLEVGGGLLGMETCVRHTSPLFVLISRCFLDARPCNKKTLSFYFYRKIGLCWVGNGEPRCPSGLVDEVRSSAKQSKASFVETPYPILS